MLRSWKLLNLYLSTVDIMDAKILVSGGRGVGSAENFKILEDLAEALGGDSKLLTCSCRYMAGNQKIFR